ncbi:MAG: dehydrogenase [Halobacteriovoraceae bacterium]|nr:dehydrogenase [Halobacteriovoraceae bacterium]
MIPFNYNISMYQNFNRRQFVKQAVIFLSSLEGLKSFAFAPETQGNFKYVYGNDKLSNDFFPFLVNVFHLFPEKELHELIKKAQSKHVSDEQIYKEVQGQISKIKPLLGDLTYALPALKKQKKIMGKQTQNLLGDQKEINGYLEIGSYGRYLDNLEERFSIENIVLMDEKEPGFGPIDIVERGQIRKAGKHIGFNDYAPIALKSNSFDLATMYIGMHHCPVSLRDDFLQNIRQSLTKDGSFIIRDHDAHNETQSRFVALAHDVFNMGTMESWNFNLKERRNFYSLEFLDRLMLKNGFKRASEHIYQPGDPTKNALMRYIKA